LEEVNIKADKGYQVRLSQKGSENLFSLVQELSDRLDRDEEVRSAELDRLKLSEKPDLNGERFFDLARVLDFRQIELPDFVSELRGFSSQEDFGRWTNSDIARIVFSCPLPARISVEVTMTAFGLNVQQPIIVVVGGAAKVLMPVSSAIKSYVLSFDCKFYSSMIEFFIPNAISPRRLMENSQDHRRLGIGIQTVKIKKRTRAVSILPKAYSTLRRFYQQAFGFAEPVKAASLMPPLLVH
jgi:hypothetical protein